MQPLTFCVTFKVCVSVSVSVSVGGGGIHVVHVLTCGPTAVSVEDKAS